MKTIVNAFNEAILSGGAEEMAAIVEACTSEYGMTEKGESLCSVLRPSFVDRATYERHLAAAEAVLEGICCAVDAVRTSDDLLDEMGLPPRQQAFLGFDRERVDVRGIGARIDGFVGHDGVLRFLEFNGGAAFGYIHPQLLGEAMLQHSAFKNLGDKHRFSCADTASACVQGALEVHAEMKTGAPHLRLGHILAPREKDDEELRHEGRQLFDALRDQGGTVVADLPEAFTWNGTNLVHETAGPVDVVIVESVPYMLLTYGFDQPLLHALAADAVRFYNGITFSLLSNSKVMFALLSDERFADIYPAELRTRMSPHIPWTRRLQERTTEAAGKTVDLLEHTMTHQQRLVLKPAAGFGGHGVSLGWALSSSDWSKAVESALSSDESWVVQERVEIPRACYPVLSESGGATLVERSWDYCPFVFASRRSVGSLTRLSAGDMLNITSGEGSIAPVVIVDDL